MRRSLVMMMLVGMSSFLAFGAPAHATCTNDTPTKAGSYKDSCGGMHCGANGEVPGVSRLVIGIREYLNVASSGSNPGYTEAELCGSKDQTGNGNASGRLMVVVDPNNGARVILDSTNTQSFPPGYLLLQAQRPDKGTNDGLYCNNNATTPVADGYTKTWSAPGQQSGAPCLQQLSPGRH
jgi:hypothetical protein